MKATASTVTLAAGAVLAVVGVVYYIRQRRATPTPSVAAVPAAKAGAAAGSSAAPSKTVSRTVADINVLIGAVSAARAAVNRPTAG